MPSFGARGRPPRWRRSSPEPGFRWLGPVVPGDGAGGRGRERPAGPRRRMRRHFPPTWSLVAPVLPESGKDGGAVEASLPAPWKMDPCFGGLRGPHSTAGVQPVARAWPWPAAGGDVAARWAQPGLGRPLEVLPPREGHVCERPGARFPDSRVGRRADGSWVPPGGPTAAQRPPLPPALLGRRRRPRGPPPGLPGRPGSAGRDGASEGKGRGRWGAERGASARGPGRRGRADHLLRA